jgi:signal peptidase I
MTESASTTGKKQQASSESVGIKETLTSLVIAFMLAFLFRGFVIEGFQIPTGSMAPTLLGKHIRFVSPSSGYDWAVGPWTYVDPRSKTQPVRNQVDISVNDPMSGLVLKDTNRRLAAGDRVFVLKYLPFLHQPKRWDVVVFKNPGSHENYIKRLVGLPGEQIAFVDGDVFTRDFVDGQTSTSGWDAWGEPGWHINRKPERVQRTMFQDVFNSRYVPVPAEAFPGFSSPFSGTTPGWEGVKSESVYRFSGAGSTALAWNGARDITDANAYNQTFKEFDLFADSDDLRKLRRPFPDSDVALHLDIEADDGSILISALLSARGMEFRGMVDSGSGEAAVEMRPGDIADGPWTRLDTGSFAAFSPGEVHDIEFWHVDQAMWLFVDEQLVCGGAEKGGYELTPLARVLAATGKSVDELKKMHGVGDGITQPGILARREIYRKPSFQWAFSGGAFTLHNVSVKRDIMYQVNLDWPTRGGDPNFFPTLSGDEFFMCGDNSSNSADSRLWAPDSIDPWVREMIDADPGMVNRDLIVGKAFVVYFPALLNDGPVLTPDVGRVRWIW